MVPIPWFGDGREWMMGAQRLLQTKLKQWAGTPGTYDEMVHLGYVGIEKLDLEQVEPLFEQVLHSINWTPLKYIYIILYIICNSNTTGESR